MLDQAKDGANEETASGLLRAIKLGAHGEEKAEILGKLAAMPRYRTQYGEINLEAIYADVDIIPVAAQPTQENQPAAAAESKLDERFEAPADELNGQPAQDNQPAQRVVWTEANIAAAQSYRDQGLSYSKIAGKLAEDLGCEVKKADVNNLFSRTLKKGEAPAELKGEWSDEAKALATTMRIECNSLDDIAASLREKCGLKVSAQKVSATLKEMGVEETKPSCVGGVYYGTWWPSLVDRAVDLHAKGLSFNQIGKVLHRSPVNVAKMFKLHEGVAEKLAQRQREVMQERAAGPHGGEVLKAQEGALQQPAPEPAAPQPEPQPEPKAEEPTLGGMGGLGGLGDTQESPQGDDEADEEPEGQDDEDADEDQVEDEGSNKPDFNEVYAFVESYTKKLGVIMLLNGRIERVGQKKATTFEELRERYKQGRISKEDLRHILKAEAGKQGLKLGSHLNTAIAWWGRKQAEGRRDAIFTAVNVLNPNPQPGWEKLVRMAAVRFEGPPEYGAAFIEQIIWETQRRIFGEEEDYGVEDPHFYLFSSKQRWNGKSRLCRDIFSPVRELIRGSVRFSAMMDERWHGLWNSPALVIDEIGLNSNRDRATLAKLKGIITEYEKNQRPMGGKEVDQVENRTVLVGNSQYKCADLFGDPDGMPRYMEVRLVPGFRYKEKDHALAAKVREATEAINWLEVWQGIDFLDDEPIILRGQRAYLDTLQAAMTPEPLRDSFNRWLDEVTQASLLTYRPKEQRSERILFSGVFRHYMDRAQHYPVPPLNKEEFRFRMMAVTCNISTKGGREPDQPEAHHRFDRKDAESSTNYKYIGPNR